MTVTHFLWVTTNKIKLIIRIVDEKRLNVKMVLPESYDVQDQISILNEKVKEKYDGESIL